MITALASDEVHVWHRVTSTTSAAMPDDGRSVLSPEECTRRDRFHFSHDRRDYALAHDLLRRSLSRYAAVPPDRWEFVKGRDGKPFICGGAISFNLSHSRGLVACAIARGIAVGVDVERTDRLTEIESPAERFFSASESAALRNDGCDQRARFFDLWTLKEAFIKAVGTGLSLPLHTFSFDLEEHESRIGFAAPPGFDAADWQFALYAPRPNARLAVAAHAPGALPLNWHAHEIDSGGLTRIEPVKASRR